MAKKICVIGVGYVGLITAVGLSDFGNTVVGVDVDEEKVKSLNQGQSIIYEPGLEEYLHRNISSGRLRFSTDVGSAIKESDVVFVAVGTPSLDNGDADLSYLYTVVEDVVKHAVHNTVLVIKSTVPVGTNRTVSDYLLSKGKSNISVVSNPEFLREGKAVYDFFHPDRVIIGCNNPVAKEMMEDVYRALNRTVVPFVWCDWESAELIKYASNGFLAMKVAYINQIACLAEEAGADINIIARAMGMDGRIGSKFLHAGPGFGGSCFPKDIRALSKIGKKYGSPISLIDCVIGANENQKLHIFKKIKKRLENMQGKTVGILGLAFKAETDDIRESPAIVIVELLQKAGSVIKAHDPKAMANFKKLFPSVQYVDSEYDVAEGADALIILTEWNEYRSLDLEKIKRLMKTPYIFDTRKVIDEDSLKQFGFLYDVVGKKTQS